MKSVHGLEEKGARLLTQMLLICGLRVGTEMELHGDARIQLSSSKRHQIPTKASLMASLMSLMGMVIVRIVMLIETRQ